MSQRSGSVHLRQMERAQGLPDEYWSADTIEAERRKRLVRSYQEAIVTRGWC